MIKRVQEVTIHYPLGYDVRTKWEVNHHYLYPHDQNKWSRRRFESHYFYLLTGRLSKVSITVRVRTEENFLRARESLQLDSLAMTSSSSRNLRREVIQITAISNVGR